jgi:sugar phosphate isomerase/epimerase
MVKKLKTYLFLLALCAICVSCQKTSPPWKVGVQSYTFHRFTFVETLDKLQSLGLQHIEVYFGQRLGEGFGDQRMDFRMDKATQTKVLEAAKAKGIQIIACGVVICDSEQEWEQLFRFAKEMDISIITCEPKPEHLDFVEQLTGKYEIDIAIHNHPRPSNYWKPDLVMQALEGRSPRMGVCADVGHWKREGHDPVKGLEHVSSRLKALHFKDIKEYDASDAEQHDVIWGTGICDVPAMLRVLKEIKFKGLMSIEYEHNWDNSVPDIRESLETMKANL